MSDQGQAPPPLDPVELRLRARSGPRSAARLVALVRRSLRLVWKAGPRQVVLLGALHPALGATINRDIPGEARLGQLP